MKTIAIKPPIIVASDGDLDIFESLEKAIAYMEPIDAQNGEYTAVYDSEGRLITIEALLEQSGWFSGLFSRFLVPYGKVIVRDVEEQPGHAKELEERLRTHLEWVYEVKGRNLNALVGASLQELVAAALEFKQ